MMDKVINKDSPEYVEVVEKINNEIERIERLTNIVKPTFDNDIYYTSEELCDKLKISKRTLHDYREKQLIPYITLNGKYLYKESDMMAVFKANYQEAFTPFDLKIGSR